MRTTYDLTVKRTVLPRGKICSFPNAPRAWAFFHLPYYKRLESWSTLLGAYGKIIKEDDLEIIY